MLRRYLLAASAAGLIGPAVFANTVTISAVASLTGRAHFQSDVRVFNRSFDAAVHVTATYFCSTAPCGESPRSFDLSPRQSMAFDDIAANLFNAPGTQGAVTFESAADEIVATSRLYSVESSGDFTGGSVGQFVPGLDPTAAFSQSVLTSLRNSADATTGFRSNITAFNPSPSAAAHVTYSLFDATADSLGTFIATILPNGFQPAFAIFGVTGASATGTENAYCVVASDQPIFVAASILDNISQDTIFVTGSEDDQGPTPSYPAAGFTFSPANPTAGQPVNFADTSTGGPTSWSWNFGDQSPAATTQNPSHTFATAGTYFVTLTASNAGGSAAHTEQLTVGTPPMASFTISPPSPTQGKSVAFTDTSSGTPTSWSWNFGDPTSGAANASTSRNPTHTFSGAGAFTVSLTATNTFGASVPAQIIVTVVSAAPTANFTFAPASPAQGATVTFTDTSTGNPTSWSWVFGDPTSGAANTSDLKNPSHVYAAQTVYTVSLVASNAFGSSSPRTEDISVGPAAGPNIIVVNVQEYGYNDCNPILVQEGVTYKIQFHALDNGQSGAGHGFSGVPSLGLREHHFISTAADYTTEAFTPTSINTYFFVCSAQDPDCGSKSGKLCNSGHETMGGSIEVTP